MFILFTTNTADKELIFLDVLDIFLWWAKVHRLFVLVLIRETTEGLATLFACML